MATPTKIEKAKAQRPDGRVTPFPLEKFLAFCERLLIQSKDAGVIHFEPLGSQRYVLEEIVEGLSRGVTTFVILKSRQLGISTLFLALDLFWAFEYPGRLGVFATHDEGSRDQFRNQIEVFLTGLPKSHKIDYETNNRLMLVLKNLSVFRYLVAGTRTTTNKLGRSGGCNYAHMTEVAFWGSAEDIDSLQQTFSETNPNRLYVYESTANGYNHYEAMWRIACESPAQKAIFCGWWRDERNEFSADHPLYPHYMPQGVKSRLSGLEKERVKEVKRLYNFDITAGQIAWYRYHLENKCKNDQSMMDQEQPWTADHAFITSGSNFFDSTTLTDASREAVKHLCAPFVIKHGDTFTDTAIQQVSSTKRCDLKIWEMPKPGGRYILGADPIFGSSDNRDNGVMSIFRAYADCIVQVAEFTSPSISPHQFAWTLAFLAGLYDDVYLILELNGPGQTVFGELKQLKKQLAKITTDDARADMRNCLKHMKHFLYSRPDSMTGNAFWQWQSSPKLREDLLYLFHDGMTTRRLRLRSMHAIDEAKYLTIDEGYIGVPAGKNDDRVFGAALAYLAWDRKMKAKLQRLASMTIIETEKLENEGDRSQIEGMVQRFMKNAKISIPNH